MTANEIELIKLIRENGNYEDSIVTAVNIITSFLEQLQSFEGQAPVCPQEHA